jgi:hypothetical protein
VFYTTRLMKRFRFVLHAMRASTAGVRVYDAPPRI